MSKEDKFELDFRATLKANPAFRRVVEENPVIRNLAYTVWDKATKRANKEKGNGVHKELHTDTSTESWSGSHSGSL
jgi:hypothetical protein